MSVIGPHDASLFTEITNKHPASSRFDIGPSCAWDRCTVDVRVKNVLNQLQVLNAVAPGNNLRGPPREFWVCVCARRS